VTVPAADRVPERFELTFPVEAADIDELGHVNNTVYVRWVQEIATAHWRASAPPDAQADLVWVVARHEIDYKHSALLGDRILARTWVGPASRLAFERNTEMFRAADAKLLAKARTIWVPLDPRTGRPCEVSAEVRERFSTPGPLERAS
jgi:acyl-CoA thioester hydrolase